MLSPNQFKLALCLVLTSLAPDPAWAGSQRIYRCPQVDAPPLFSGTPCASAHQLAPVIRNQYAPTPLTPEEQAQLRQLAQRTSAASNGSSSSNTTHQKAKTSARISHAATQACARHQEALKALQIRRRKGYKLSEAARLDQQEHGLRQNIRLHC